MGVERREESWLSQPQHPGGNRRVTPTTQHRGEPIDLSLVIPLYNEAESLRPLYRETHQVLESVGRSWEMIFVDDGSTDGSLAILTALHHEDPRVKVVSLRTNFGKSAALAAGLKEASGTHIITLDADLQDDPVEIPRLLAALENGFDLVAGWKNPRQDSFFRVQASRIFNRLVSLVAGVRLHDLNCGLKGYRRDVIPEIPIYGELHRFIPVLAHWRGFRVTEIAVGHRRRRFGNSKFGWGRGFRGMMDLLTVMFLTRFQRRPAHFFGLLGTLTTMAGAAIISYIFYLRLTYGNIQNRHPLLIGGVLLIVVGIQLLTTGLLGEIITDIRRQEDGYSVQKKLL